MKNYKSRIEDDRCWTCANAVCVDIDDERENPYNLRCLSGWRMTAQEFNDLVDSLVDCS